MTNASPHRWLLPAAAFFEIAGCFAFWACLRLGRSPWWTLVGVGSLVLFAVRLTRVDSAYAGRAFAAYGGVYIVASLLWLWSVEGMRPDRTFESNLRKRPEKGQAGMKKKLAERRVDTQEECWRRMFA